MKKDTLAVSTSNTDKPIDSDMELCEPVNRMLRELDLVDERTSSRSAVSSGVPDEPTVGSSVTDGKARFRCIMDRIPKDFCHSPIRCQQKLRLLRRALRKTSNQTMCATGLELAAGVFLGSLRTPHTISTRKLEKSQTKAVEATPIGPTSTTIVKRNDPTIHPHPRRLEKFFYSSLFIPSVSDGTDWQVENQCVFCVADNPQEASLTSWHTMPLPYICPTTLKNVQISTKKKKSPILAKSSLRIREVLVDHLTSSSTEVPTVLKPKKCPKIGQRKYSPAELTAAIDEVERGRVGTRKAAILYGIPRSTLRNKVGKLLTQKSATCQGVETSVKSREKGSVGGLKRAASADLTSALKKIISRHITAKNKSEEDDMDKEVNNQRDSLRYKRGRYRRYDKGDLEEALKAVRKGEMTVHRAGHFFGIPHSTLEYKIKEGNTVTKCSTTDTDIVMEDKQPSSSSSSLDMPDSAFSQSEAQKKLDKKTSTAPIMNIATQMAFNWPRDNMMAGMNFGLAPLFFGSPFSDLFTGFRGAQTAAFLADSAAQEKMLPFYALHHQGKSAFTSPFRPWAPPEKKDKSGQASQKDQGCAQMIPEEDEPLDLIKKEVSVKVTD